MTARVFVSLARTPNERPHELMIFLSESNITKRTNDEEKKGRGELLLGGFGGRSRWASGARAPALPSLLPCPRALRCAAPVFWTMSTTRLKGLIEKMKSRRRCSRRIVVLEQNHQFVQELS